MANNLRRAPIVQRTLLFCSLMAALMACAYAGEHAQPFDPEHSPLIKHESQNGSIRVVKQGSPTSIAVQKAGQPESVLELPLSYAQVDQIVEGPSNRSFIRGRVDHFTGDVVVLDHSKSAPTILDNIWGYKPSVSPDGRWLAFIRWYPPRGEYQCDDQYRLYDITRASKSSRADKPGDTTVGPGVGRPIYSLKANEVNREVCGVDEAASHSSASQFFWSSDSTRLAFVDSQSGSMSAVMVTFSVAAEPRTLVARLVGLNDLCRSDCTYMRVTSIAYLSTGLRLEIINTLHKELPSKAIELSYEDFLPAPTF